MQKSIVKITITYGRRLEIKYQMEIVNRKGKIEKITKTSKFPTYTEIMNQAGQRAAKLEMYQKIKNTKIPNKFMLDPIGLKEIYLYKLVTYDPFFTENV
jgi:uncharacterized protein YegJ (DUF2314 family)